MSNLYSSKNPKKKQCIILYCFFILPIFLYLAISLSALTQIKIDAKHIVDQVVYFLTHFIEPRKINDKTLFFVFFGIVVWLMAFVFSYQKASMRLMHGEEHGTSSWGSIKQFNKKYADSVESENKILSEHIRMTYDTRTLRNNNMFVVGGSGAGKTAFLVSPNLLNVHGSNIYTDPKGSLIEDYGEYLKKQPDTRVYCINLCEMDKSMKFNPFDFIRSEIDVPKLINNIIKNTTPQEQPSSADPFWEQAESMYLQAVFYYIWLECPRNEIDAETGKDYVLEKNFISVLKLLDEAKMSNIKGKTRFEVRLDELPESHFARRTYDRMKVAAKAEETIASIVLCANSRFNKFDNPQLMNILSDNDVPLDEIGTGVNFDGKTKSFVFLIIPDDDDTYNFIPGMFYTLLFQELYYQARFYAGNKLPIDVGFWFDEFANIKMPSNFEKILATCRSRKVYCVPILQSLAQIKKLFKDGAWEGIVGNCDTLVYLGGNEQSSHKYISELLGKWTIDKQTTGESKGQSGSSSKNLDVLGRDLIDASEMRLLPNDKEIIFVRGEKPLIDRKWHPWEQKIHSIARDCGDYEFSEEDIKVEEESLLLNDEQLEYYERKSKLDPNIRIHDDVDLATFLSVDFDEFEQDDELSDDTINDLLTILSETDVEKIEREEAEKKRQIEVANFMQHYDECALVDIYTSDLCEDERKDLIMEYRKLNVPEEDIKRAVAFDIPVKKVKENFNLAKSYYAV